MGALVPESDSNAEIPSTADSLLLKLQDAKSPSYKDWLSVFFKRYWSAFYAYYRRTSVSREDAKDLVQALFLSCVDDASVFADHDPKRGRFQFYMIRILKSRKVDLYRKRGKELEANALLLDADNEGYMEKLEGILADPKAFTAEGAFLREWAVTTLRRGLAILTEKFRIIGGDDFQILEWLKRPKQADPGAKEKGRPSTKEMAEKLGIEEATFRQRVGRLRGCLRDELAAEIRELSPGAAEIGKEVQEILETTARPVPMGDRRPSTISEEENISKECIDEGMARDDESPK